MFWLIKQVFIVLLGFSRSLATKCMSLNDESCMIRSTFIDISSTELNYFTFTISLDKCNGSCNVVDYLSKKYVSRAKQKTWMFKYLIW